ncbi:neurofilament heavy polypeptide-like protein [Lasius niger]|uniref:Neurofilament heavy polypeptide-like protein n=1 Tax=Lasius niger TaxID=67767 RepID=A0A0J7NM23_LASNI|nr:neurofilament heavy polypeptide-like protein [Lasius niger]
MFAVATIGSNLKDVIPVPPPRRKKRNRGRPLPPKPDEIPVSVTNNLRHGDTCEEPLYLSVRSSKTNGDDGDDRDDGDFETRGTGKICPEDPKHEGRRTKEIYEHKVNGTGRIISSEVVSGRRTSADKKTSRTSESGHHHRKVLENEEYERFAGSQSIKDSSTPNRQDRRKSKELEQRIRDPSRDDDRPEANTRTKNYSTVSLPNYDELDVSRHPAKSTAKDERGTGEKMKSRRPVRSSTGSLPAESFLSPFSEKTSVLLEDYLPRRGSIEHLSTYQVLGKLGSSENEVTDGGFMKYDPNKLEDWDLSDISNCDPNRRLSAEYSPRIHNDERAERRFSKGIDVVDYSQHSETGEAETTEVEISCVRRDMTSPLQKPESFGKAPSPIFDSDRESKYPDDWLTDRDRYFDPPKMSEICHVSPTCELATSPVRREPFYLNEELHRSALDTIGGSCRNGVVIRESDRSDQSRLIFGRNLSNESEPYDDPYESKELRAHSDVTNKLIRTISEESLPQEMLERVDEEIIDFFDEKLAKDTTNELKKDCQEQRMKTPPPSPEPKIKAQILDNDHSTLLKVLNDDAADGSNLSSMTPSLTELEAALSDMLEKEDQPDETAKRENTNGDSKQIELMEKLLEPKIVPVDKHNAVNRNMSDQHSSVSDDILVDKTLEHKTSDQSSVSLEQILVDSTSTPKKRKVSFCTWEEKVITDVDLINNEEFEAKNVNEATGLDIKSSVVVPELGSTSELFGDIEINSAKSIGEAPEKPSRLFQSLEDVAVHSTQIPTPPRRKNKSLSSTQESVKIIENYPEDPDPRPNDRLI